MIDFPPSLSRVRGPFKSTDRRTRQQEHLIEKDKKREERIAAVEDAMKALPLKVRGEGNIRKLSGSFEQTLYATENKATPATTKLMEGELRALAKSLQKVSELLTSLHANTIRIWAADTDAEVNVSSLFLTVDAAKDWAESGLGTLRRAKRIGGPGRQTDFKAEWMRQTAAFAYEQLTLRRAGTAYDAYSSREIETPFASFLQRIFEIYGIGSSAKSRARKRKPMAKKTKNSR
jgi:hypothetical protein